MNQPDHLPANAHGRIATIASQWHAELVAAARDAFVDDLARRGWPPDRIDRHDVPGAFEIPLRAQRLAREGRVSAIVAFALVVDGGIYRHDFVAQAVIDGLMRVQLDTGVPVLSVVLTPHAFHEHEVHTRFFAEHLATKGREAANACRHVLGAFEARADAVAAAT